MARQKNDGKGRMGGRKKGTPNKTTSQLREVLAECWRDYHESGLFAKDLKQLEPHERAVLMEKYAAYLAPKMKSVDLDVNGSVNVKTIEDELQKLSEENDI